MTENLPDFIFLDIEHAQIDGTRVFEDLKSNGETQAYSGDCIFLLTFPKQVKGIFTTRSLQVLELKQWIFKTITIIK